MLEAEVRAIKERSAAALRGIWHLASCRGAGCSCGLENLRADVPALCDTVLRLQKELEETKEREGLHADLAEERQKMMGEIAARLGKPSGLCSKHQSGALACPLCYPDWQAVCNKIQAENAALRDNLEDMCDEAWSILAWRGLEAARQRALKVLERKL